MPEPWDRMSDPTQTLKNRPGSSLQFSSLPLSGKTEQPLSSPYFYPLVAGSFLASDKPSKSLRKDWVFTASDARQLSAEELKTLSPLEKLTLLQPCDSVFFNPDTPKHTKFDQLKSYVMKEIQPYPGMDNWWGNCNYAAQVSKNIRLNKTDPNRTISGCDGIQIPVSDDDLLAFSMMSFEVDLLNEQADPNDSMLGLRNNVVREKNIVNTAVCGQPISSGPMNLKKFSSLPRNARDVNAGSFHLVLANLLGKDHETFAIDLDPGQPTLWATVESYTSKVLKTQKPEKGAAVESVKSMLMETNLKVVNFHTVPTSRLDYKVRYWLELDAQDQIVGGRWASKVFPDMLWEMKPSPNFFKPGFEFLEEYVTINPTTSQPIKNEPKDASKNSIFIPPKQKKSPGNIPDPSLLIID